jgi:hypothetical protein
MELHKPRVGKPVVDDDDRRCDCAHVILLKSITPFTRRHAPSLPGVILGAPHVTAHAHRRVEIGQHRATVQLVKHWTLAINDGDNFVRENVRLQLASPRILLTKVFVLTKPAIDRILAWELTRSTQLVDCCAAFKSFNPAIPPDLQDRGHSGRPGSHQGGLETVFSVH